MYSFADDNENWDLGCILVESTFNMLAAIEVKILIRILMNGPPYLCIYIKIG